MSEIEKRVADFMQHEIDAAFAKAMFGNDGTSTNAVGGKSTLTPEKLDHMMEDWRKLIFDANRTRVTIVVEAGHVGGIISHREPNKGEFFEMDWRTAQAVHEEWPLVLAEIIDEGTAYFRPATGWDLYVPKILPMPPYEMRPTEDQPDAP